MCDNITQALIKAIREEIWANNQMQLAAFYENQQPLIPPPPPKALPSQVNRPEKHLPLFFTLLFIMVLFYVVWFVLLCAAVVQRSGRAAHARRNGGTK
jgi:hypothetical protein